MAHNKKFEALYRAQALKLAAQWQAKADKVRKTGGTVTGYTSKPLDAEGLDRLAEKCREIARIGIKMEA